MNIVDKLITLQSKSDIVKLYPIGDTHIGALNCAEGHIRRYVRYIARQKCQTFWIGGGDYCDCITRNDLKRFDPRVLPDWMLEGTGATVRERLTDIGRCERKRFLQHIEPIKDRCLGLIEGNHEDAFEKRTDTSMQLRLCEALHVPNLTDVAFVRLRFRLASGHGGISTVIVYIVHGSGGGTSDGAEAIKLAGLAKQVEGVDIVLRGHGHRVTPGEPVERTYIPRKGALPWECYSRTTYTGNWGSWLKTYARGNPTYPSKRNYPPRAFRGLEFKIQPFASIAVHKGKDRKLASITQPIIELTLTSYADAMTDD